MWRNKIIVQRVLILFLWMIIGPYNIMIHTYFTTHNLNLTLCVCVIQEHFMLWIKLNNFLKIEENNTTIRQFIRHYSFQHSFHKSLNFTKMVQLSSHYLLTGFGRWSQHSVKAVLCLLSNSIDTKKNMSNAK